MGSLRDQMQLLADDIAKSRRERKTCMGRIAKDRQQLRVAVAKQREQIQRELAQQSHELTHKLSNFNRSNQKAVSQSLRESRQTRSSRSRTLLSKLRQQTALNRRTVARTLRQHNTERQRMRQKQERASVLAHQSVTQSVNRLRNSTHRMTRTWSIDRREAKQLWQRLSTSTAISRAQPAPNSTAVAALRIPPVLVTPTLSLSGLPLPPVR